MVEGYFPNFSFSQNWNCMTFLSYDIHKHAAFKSVVDSFPSNFGTNFFSPCGVLSIIMKF